MAIVARALTMPIQRIDHPGCRSYGFQVRVQQPGFPRKPWTRFFADEAHGGAEHAYRLAQAEERDMRAMAARLRAARGR